MTKEYMKHFNDRITKEIKSFATDEVLIDSRYLFTRREGKKQLAYCTHCKKEYEPAETLKHQAIYRPYHYCHAGLMQCAPDPAAPVKCPNCKSDCHVKASGVSRKYLVDVKYFVYFEKSLIDPEAITARGFIAVRDYTKDYRDVQTQYLEATRYLFKMNGSRMFSNNTYYWNKEFHNRGRYWESRASIFPDARHEKYGGEYSYESLMDATRDTPFQYSCWQQFYKDHNILRFLDNYSRYPCIEYLTKLGLKKIVDDKLTGKRTYGAVNWKGKTLNNVLKLTKDELKEIKENHINVDCHFLYFYRMAKKNGADLTMTELGSINIPIYYEDEFLEMVEQSSFRKAINYIKKQCKTNPKIFSTSAAVARTWHDYINDCKTLGLDIKDLKVAFPTKLHNAHQNTNKQVRIKADKEMNIKIAARAKQMKKLCFSYKGLTIRPAQSTEELIAEGKALHHCVGGYAPQYASGRSTILLVRQNKKPNTPFYTVELYNSEMKITQVRGKNNCPADEKVKKFIETYKKEILAKVKKPKIKIPA